MRTDDGTQFTGALEIREVNVALETAEVKVNALYFEESARSRPHLHDADQVLYFLEGPGMVAVDGGPDQIVPVGSFVMLPANVPHMHGAPKGGRAAHISLMPAQHINDFDCPIPDAWRQWRK